MNKQIQSRPWRYSSSYPHEGAADVFSEKVELDNFLSSSSPGISIFPADSSEAVLEFDSYTGLPKLPIEPPSPATSPGPVVRPKLGSLTSALRMSSSPVKRKSVTFTDVEKTENQSVKLKEKVSPCGFLRVCDR